MISPKTLSSTYEIKFLGEVVNFLDNMRRPITESERKAGKYPYYGANGQLGNIDSYIFDESLVLLAEDGGFFDQPDRGIAYRIEGKTWVNNHAHVLRPKNEIYVGYLYRVLQNYNVKPFVSGTTRDKLTKGGASLIPIPVPPIPEQRKITEILDKADELRAKRCAAIALLDTLPQTIFIEMFGDPVVNPKVWPLKKLGHIGKLDRGVSKHRPRNAPELLGGIYPFVQTGDIANSDGYVRSFKNTYSDLGLKQSKLWPIGTLCITIAANIAKTGILTFDACFPDSIVGFCAKESATVELVRTWLSFKQESLEDSAPESAQKNINLAILRDLDIPFPPLPLQQDFARRVLAIDKLKSAHRASLAKLDELFASLQYRAFRGEL